jgi:hypothetical protein
VIKHILNIDLADAGWIYLVVFGFLFQVSLFKVGWFLPGNVVQCIISCCVFVLAVSKNKSKDNKDAGPPQYDLFTESIEEEIKKEDWQKLWGKYGKIVSAFVVCALVGIFVFNYWQKQRLEEREAMSTQFVMALNLSSLGDQESAISAFRAISQTNHHGYASLAKFEIAAILRKKNDKGAVDVYKELSQDVNYDKSTTDLAYIYYVRTALEFVEKDKIEQLLPEFVSGLLKIIKENTAKVLALESLAYCYIRSGQKDLASETLENLIKTEGVPSAMLDRAKVVRSAVCGMH